MTSRALLKSNSSFTLNEAKQVRFENLCRCNCRSAIANAMAHAGEKMANNEEEN
jgi:hypothetical protein